MMNSPAVQPHLSGNLSASAATFPWVPDLGNGTYCNPVLFADYSDPDVIAVGEDFYLTASSFNCVPGLPILHSKDLVNWTLIGHVFDKYPVARFSSPQHGCGVWAPSLRHYQGEFYVYFGDPDHGVYMSKARHPAGPWEPLHLVRPAKGWIDTCPFWDDDGNAYLVHAWAKSRAGINSILTINRMSPDGRSLLDDGTLVFDGRAHHHTVEGPKLYKRDGWYYIFAPAGGVKEGWQTVLRSRKLFGPYEDRIVLAQRQTTINGPHQGGWVETRKGECWFLHFQDRGAYGRVVHLQPMRWKDGWPLIGINQNNEGVGEPVLSHPKPATDHRCAIAVPPTTDGFDSPRLGPQWQWQANYEPSWFSLAARPGWLRLFALQPPRDTLNLWQAPNLLLQKFPAPKFTVTAAVDSSKLAPGSRTGLIVMGPAYSWIGVSRGAPDSRIVKVLCPDASGGGAESVEQTAPCPAENVWLRVQVGLGGICEFSYSHDGKLYHPLGNAFTAREGKWIGAKVGLFCLANPSGGKGGWADIDAFQFA